MSNPPDRLSKLVQMRTSTDAHIGMKWIFFATANYVLWTTLALLYFTGWLRQIPSFGIPLLLGSIFFDATTWLSLLGFGASTGLAYLVFRVVDRQNKHALRMQEIFSESLERVASETRPDQVSILLPLNSAQQDLSALIQKTRERSAVLWAMLILIPYMGWIFLSISLYQLTQSSQMHEQNERLILEDLNRVLSVTGSQPILVNNRHLSSRNNAAFLLASLFTVGLFSLFWLYQIISIPEKHFRYHSDFEPNMLAAFARSPLAEGTRT